MNYNKKLKLAHSKSKVQWWAIFAIFGIFLAFTACEKKSVSEKESDPVEEYPSLKVENRVSDDRSIYSVRLVGYEFNNLNIGSGDSQTFSLDNGMQGGYENLNIKVIYGNPYRPSNSISTKVNFYKGKIRTITLEGCIDYEGCHGHYLE